MEPVNIIKRIIALDEAMERIPISEKYDDIYVKLYNKRKELRKSLRAWRSEYPKNSEICKTRKHQFELACRLLGVDKHYITYSL